MFDKVYAPKAERKSIEWCGTQTIYSLDSKVKCQRDTSLPRADAFTH